MYSAQRLAGVLVGLAQHDALKFVSEGVAVLLVLCVDQKELLFGIKHRHEVSTSGTNLGVHLVNLLELVKVLRAISGVLEPFQVPSDVLAPVVHLHLEHVHGFVEAPFAGVLAVVDVQTKVC